MKKLVDGVEIEMTDAEIALKQAEDKANLEGTLVQRMALLRNKRNILLAETDWMANSDVVMSNDWKTYRQALRDITKTEPVDMALSNITFPTKPS
jgi:hypothetical protein|tara:strand:+ start:600 stop:884 length:285 start_codon:yes stop_codon:yes gene_type:complete